MPTFSFFLSDPTSSNHIFGETHHNTFTGERREAEAILSALGDEQALVGLKMNLDRLGPDTMRGTMVTIPFNREKLTKASISPAEGTINGERIKRLGNRMLTLSTVRTAAEMVTFQKVSIAITY